jgi:hypothetical protein
MSHVTENKLLSDRFRPGEKMANKETPQDFARAETSYVIFRGL